MQSIDEIRRHPANQHAAELLRAENQPPQNDPLPVFQLMQLGLESKDLEIRPKYRPSLESAVASAVSNPNQEIPFQFLILTDIQEERDLSAFLEESDPIAAAGILLEELHSKLGATVPGYHSQSES